MNMDKRTVIEMRCRGHGKPTATGTFSFTVKVTDSLGNTDTQGLSIKINN